MVQLLGCDFSSSPNARKNIVLTWGRSDGERLRLERLERLASLDAFSQALAQEPAWVGGFDLPFGLPRPGASPGLAARLAGLHGALLRFVASPHPGCICGFLR